MISWKSINEFIEPNWVNENDKRATLFWRGAKDAAVLRHIREGELFDNKWLYVCDANKVTHFADINGP